ncbi:MAG: hypothetical protein Q7U35_03350 [Methanobacteriaceae archaeon]|nr:hypothetical protein [Methanobacteriaceae archaeon]MDP2835828.1 hypothetical protein [Methanobacteriaceae archaeon]MDP3034631.1 hypothetical protein [Methanobacteriaceae archaeon]MDP3623286.1 hypothetical protein [Methanobacteriaceae archaeon]
MSLEWIIKPEMKIHIVSKMKWAIYIEVQVGKFGKAGWNAVQAQGVIIRLEKYGINIIQK